MKRIKRRSFLKKSALGTGFLATSPFFLGMTALAQTRGTLTFQHYPHPWMPEMTWAYAVDEFSDPFRSTITASKSGIVVPAEFNSKRFSITTRWFVEGFGYLMLNADNGGENYTLTDFSGNTNLNLNFEFARSRMTRNRDIRQRYENNGTKFSSEVNHLFNLSEELYESAKKSKNDPERCANWSDKALRYALWVGEKIELEKAQADIEKYKRMDTVYFGCETRQYIWAKSEDFTKRFPEVFNFATLTHYIWDTWYEVFEPREGVYNWGVKDNIVNWLMENNIEIQGRPLFWFHPVVTPEWLKNKNFEQLKKYVEKHTHDLVTHYGDKVKQWSVMNEYHDWANIHNHSPEQITEITKLACDKTKETDGAVKRIINNCCPWGDYVPWGRMARQKTEADRPLRTPHKYMQDLTEAGVDYDVLGVQIYFPRRDLSEIVRLLERFEKFNKPIYITEIGATSFGINRKKVPDPLKLSDEPYDWHRYWDEKLQADWLEQVYTLYYSRPSIKAINWYDFSDFRPFIVNGGLVREDCSPKRSFYRLKNVLAKWNRLPGKSKEES
jgi:GH35 family endo-1,4-beta-xylanase